MATYKVIQDVEAEDKLVGPLTLWQFIYALIAVFFIWMSFLAVGKGATFLITFFAPFIIFFGFLAVPWGGDQPTEIWALAKLRFLLKPRKRIWDQSGAKELVTITVPKKVERYLTNGLNQTEVHNRLNALAATIDSRGWAVKNVNVNLTTQPTAVDDNSDRLVGASSLPQDVANVDVTAADDIMDERANPIARQFDTMIAQAETQHRQQIITQMQQPTPTAPQPQAQTTPGQPDYWFMHQPTPVAGQATFMDAPVVAPGTDLTTAPPVVPHAAAPTPEEQALVEQFKQANNSQTIAYNHLKTLRTPAQIAEDERRAAAEAARLAAEKAALEHQKAQVTSDRQAAIMSLAGNDDLNIETIAREAHRNDGSDGEVVISLR